ncbi:MAG TPA: MFS transporter [Caulobacteraceae bacterium]|nr:MFS transporter [Caulobacteraceae bacterium]
MSAIASEEAALKASRVALAALLLVMLMNMLGFGVIVPLLPFYARSFHATGWQIGLFFSGYSAGSFFGEPFWGRLSDRIGRKPILVSTVIANCVCFLALAFAPNVFVGCLVRFLGGVAGGNGSVVASYIADVTPVARRAGRMGYLGAAYNVGFIFGPGLGGLLARPAEGPAGFRAPLLVAAVLAAISALGVLLIVRESRRRGDRAPEAPRPARPRIVRQALRHPVIGRLMILTFAAGLALNGIESTFGFWATHRYTWTPANIGLCFTVAAIAATLSQAFLTGPLSRRFGQAPTLAAGVGLTALCLAMQPLSPSGLATVAIMAMMSLGQSLSYPNTAALVSGATDPDHQGQVLGLNNAMDGASRLIGPQAALALFAWTPNAPFFAGVAVTAPAVLLAIAAGGAARKLAPDSVL